MAKEAKFKVLKSKQRPLNQMRLKQMLRLNQTYHHRSTIGCNNHSLPCKIWGKFLFIFIFSFHFSYPFLLAPASIYVPSCKCIFFLLHPLLWCATTTFQFWYIVGSGAYLPVFASSISVICYNHICVLIHSDTAAGLLVFCFIHTYNVLQTHYVFVTSILFQKATYMIIRSYAQDD